MTEAAEAVTGYAFEVLEWPLLYLSNSARNLGSLRVKEKQGAVEIGREPFNYVSGPAEKVTWLLTRQAWLARRG